MKGLSTFSAVILIIFIALALFGVFIFATFQQSARDRIGTVTIWGSVPQDAFDAVIGSVRDARSDFADVTYEEVPAEALMPRLVEAIAAGRGPDLVLFPSSNVLKDGDKLAPIPYAQFSRRDFQDTFVEAGEAFLTPGGILAIPISIDPLVMYWNRSLYATAGIASPPRYWDEFTRIAPRLTVKTQSGTLTGSAVALGTWNNVSHAKAVFVTLVRDLGSPIVTRRDDGTLDASLRSNETVQPAASALRFIADFADPIKPVYSWNSAQRMSRDAFLSGTLATYFAPASELRQLRNGNPNLNFDVAQLPSARGAFAFVGAEVLGISTPRGSKNPSGALQAAYLLSAQKQQLILARELTLPSPRRDAQITDPTLAYTAVFDASALRGYVFLDPNPGETDALFARMVESVATGRATVSEALSTAHNDLQALTRMR